MTEQKETPVASSQKMSKAEELRLKRLGLWYLRDNPQALAQELERIERVTKTPPQPQ